MNVLAIIIMLPFLAVFLWAVTEMLIVKPIQKKQQKPQAPPIFQTPEESLPTFILLQRLYEQRKKAEEQAQEEKIEFLQAEEELEFDLLDNDDEEIVPVISKVEEEKEVFEEYPLVGLRVIEIPIPPTGRFPVGKIMKQEGKYLTVLFGERERKWKYPELFFTKYVRFGDIDLQEAFERNELIFMEDRVKLHRDRSLPETAITLPTENSNNLPVAPPSEELSSDLTLSKALHMIDHAVAPAWVTFSFQGDMERDGKLKHGFHYDTSGERIYRKGCEVFEWDEDLAFNFIRRSMYAHSGAPDGKSVWMLTHHNSVTPIATKETAMWWNTFVKDIVFEEWRDPTLDFYYDFSTRITFAKTTNKGYAFIGVYKPEQLLEGVDDNGKMHHIKVYRRIQMDYEG